MSFKLYALTLLSLFFVTASYAQRPGLSGGESFESQRIEGQVSVRCQSPQGSDYSVFNCRQNLLLPGERDIFVHPDKVAGDEVKLTAHHESGKVRDKSKSYSSSTGESKSFNLWIRTLFQRPLLDYGLNRIDFEVTKNGVIQDMGSFDVTVEKSDEIKTCDYAHYYSSNLNDCRDGGLSVCSRYFRDSNYCQ